ncbi:helix-turn-helix domain-containing protein [Microbacterium bovistercoris]|uniref:helix-turn-helix domain-containing protein n=1 Tax=Microbacterium bovistercoris TaxID=2293570 RepID=UPI0015F27AB7|nr:helix-turn-helix transcriptional regulator [Microbacterium bovistercoris]
MPRVPSPAAAHIGKRIRAVRVDKGLTQEQLGHEAQTDSSAIRSYENGRAMLSIRTLLRISRALKQPPEFFLKGLRDEMFEAPADDKRKLAS